MTAVAAVGEISRKLSEADARKSAPAALETKAGR
jgi:hypothetical protein